MKNPFKKPELRHCYDYAMELYERRDRCMFRPNGDRETESVLSFYFWRGFSLDDAHNAEVGSRCWAYWKAGKNARKIADKQGL